MNTRKKLGLHDSRLLLDVSLWSAPLVQMGDAVRRMEGHADLFHLDVADSYFVPTLLFFPDFVSAINEATDTPLHVHLMMREPRRAVDQFVRAGADIITVHAELEEFPDLVIDEISAAGAVPGIALTIDTPADVITPLLDRIGIIVVMGTAIGVKGVSLDERALHKIRRIKQILEQHGLQDQVIVSADGGIRENTVSPLRAAGVDMITPGSLVFGSTDLERTVTTLRNTPGDR